MQGSENQADLSMPNNSQEASKKAPIKVKRWEFDFPATMDIPTFENVLTQQKLAEKKGSKTTKEPLSQKSDGVIIDKDNHHVYLYLTKQLQYGVVEGYDYVLKDSLKPWETKAQGFDQCIKDISTLPNKDRFEILDFRNSRPKPENTEVPPTELSKLQEKQQNKKYEKLEIINNRHFNPDEDLVEKLARRILKKETFEGIFNEFIAKDDIRATVVMENYKDFLYKYERISANFQREDATKDQKGLCSKEENIQQEESLARVSFKFKDVSAQEKYKQEKKHLANIVDKEYMPKKGAKKLDDECWNYFLVAEKALEGCNYRQIKQMIESDPELQEERDLKLFLSTIVKPTNSIAQRSEVPNKENQIGTKK